MEGLGEGKGNGFARNLADRSFTCSQSKWIVRTQFFCYAEEVKTNFRSMPLKTKKKNPAAVALGRLGGKIGGPARAQKLSRSERKSIATKAGKARMKSLSKAQRSALARKAGAARWSQKTK